MLPSNSSFDYSLTRAALPHHHECHLESLDDRRRHHRVVQPRVQHFLNLHFTLPHTHTRSFTSFFIIWFSIPFFMRASASNSTGSSLYPSHPPLSPTDSSEWYGVEHPLSALKRRSFTTYMRAIFTRGGKGLAMS